MSKLLLAVECICVAMLVRVRRRLIDVGENFILMELMHYEIDEQEGSDTIIIAQGITRAAKMLLTLMGNETSATKDGTGSTTQFLDDVDAELLSQVALGANLESIITTEIVCLRSRRNEMWAPIRLAGIPRRLNKAANPAAVSRLTAAPEAPAAKSRKATIQAR